MHAFPHLAAIDWLALAVFFSCWAGYAWFSEHSARAAGGLIGTSQRCRLDWAYRMLERGLYRRDYRSAVLDVLRGTS